MENVRIDRGSVGDHLHISWTSAEEEEDEGNKFVCTLRHSKRIEHIHSLLMIQETHFR